MANFQPQPSIRRLLAAVVRAYSPLPFERRVEIAIQDAIEKRLEAELMAEHYRSVIVEQSEQIGILEKYQRQYCLPKPPSPTP